MEIPSTDALRPVNSRVQRAIGELPAGAFNFGLYFNKWFHVLDSNRIDDRDRWPRGKKCWPCTMQDETALVGNRGEDWCPPNPLLDNFQVSIALFNGEPAYERKHPVEIRGRHKESDPKRTSIQGNWDREKAEEALRKRHEALDGTLRAFERIGYRDCSFTVPCATPLVIGLGNEHPTEKGFRFDWSLGVPIIPASGVKGVIRLGFLVEELNRIEDDAEAEAFWKHTSKGLLSTEARETFGCGEHGDAKQGARRGKAVFLDALPETLPRLKPEIMNCHYPEYLNRNLRGPTEDQSPNPQKFWAVDAMTRENGKEKPLKFVFRILVDREIADDPDRLQLLQNAIGAALDDHGFGAKTAIGHGRFEKPSFSDSGSAPNGKPAASTPKGMGHEEIEERIEKFREVLKKSKNLSGEVDNFIGQIRAEAGEPTLQKRMCETLVDVAKNLPDKKKRLLKALKKNSGWAQRVESLCQELELSDLLNA
jgi:CRISPR-associated protein Cmr6